MMHALWIDPVKYVDTWVIPEIDVPNPSEYEDAVVALRHLGSLLYSNPSLVHMSKREKFYVVRRQLRAIAARIDDIGFIPYIVELNDVGHAFLRGFTIEDATVSYDSSAITSSPLLGAIRQLDVQNADDTYLENNHLLIQYIYTWHIFLAKIPLSRPDLEDSALQAWIDRQSYVRERQFNPSVTFVRLRRLISWLINIDKFDLPGRHGPGSTAGGAKSIAEKNAAFRPTIKTVVLTPFSPIQDVSILLDDNPDSQFHLVPKDAKNLRPITAEDPAVQYSQQSLKMKWYHATDFLAEHPIRHFVRYSTQRRSQVRALRGSSLRRDDSNPATLDLKSASDYLSLRLIRSLFSGDLLNALLAGRSSGCVTPSGRVEFGMYAGMGSALTFPVQTTVFTAIAVLATLIALWRRDMSSDFLFEEALTDYLDGNGFKPSFKKYGRSIQIYGDDIIVPEIAVADTLRILDECGLIVNTSKSFTGTDGVRESCGMFALGGWDITPLRYRVPVTNNGGRLDYSAFEGLRSLVNRSFIYGYGDLYRYSLMHLRTAPKLISNNEWKRLARALGKKPHEVNFDDYMLFEQYRGRVDYLGVISSSRDSRFTHVVEIPRRDHNGEVRFFDEVKSHNVVLPKVDSDLDSSSEFYHLQQAYVNQYMLESQSEDHGRIPRGIRLVFGNATRLLKMEDGSSVMAWGLAT